MSCRIFQGTRAPGIGWFRVFGYGLHWKDERRHRLLFSERYGFRSPHFRIGAWRFRFTGPPEARPFDAIATTRQYIVDARLFDEAMAQTNRVLGESADLGGEA